MALSIRERMNVDDPSGLLSTEDRRATESLRDFDAVIARVLERVELENATEALSVQRIVEQELGTFSRETEYKLTKWVLDTAGRGSAKAVRTLRTGGLQVDASLGPREASQEVKDILTVSVQNDIASLSASTRAKLAKALIDGMSAGDGARDLTRRIETATGMERNRAETIARTETMEAFREASSDQYAKHGIEEEEWLTAEDDRVCDECAALDGKRFPIGQAPRVHGGTNARCRCIRLPVIPRVDQT